MERNIQPSSLAIGRIESNSVVNTEEGDEEDIDEVIYLWQSMKVTPVCLKSVCQLIITVYRCKLYNNINYTDMIIFGCVLQIQNNVYYNI